MNKELQELQDKLREVEKTRDDLKRQILAKTSEDLLNKFEPGKYYEVYFASCQRFYYHCINKPTLRSDGLVFFSNIVKELITMMYYDTTLCQTASFDASCIPSWEIKEISKEDYLEEITEYKDKISKLIEE